MAIKLILSCSLEILGILSNEDLDSVKTRTKEAALRNYNNNIAQHFSKEEILALQNQCKNKNFVIQKSDKGNSVVIVDKTDSFDKMKDLLNDTRNFEKINLKYDGTVSFAISQEKCTDNILKRLVASISLSDETRKSLKPLKTRMGITYGLCKVLCNVL